ncbi:DUF6904 family protein [Pedobacter soli]|uniref:Uncharacterized protein n=1 Tax=Pedobacter soli TaxID=390242 RepID=A0A1G6WLX5_9SPHI|nr:hypothetical protein [Pedobacter soli]SDD66769.1 hypothetical protein SAMN04488024_10758 [Pedobacter soli]
MFYFTPTKKGLGAELWGTYDDLRTIYEVIGKFWSQEGYTEKSGFFTRDQILSGFAHEIRKAYEGQRLTREYSHFMPDPVPHFGCRLSWVHIIFSINAIRFNMRYFENNKMDLGLLLQIEYWIEESLRSFDAQGALSLIGYLNSNVDAANPYLYQYMRSINADYFALRGGKTAFRQLSKLFRRAAAGTDDYQAYHSFLTIEAQRLKCGIEELELSDDDLDYDKLIW